MNRIQNLFLGERNWSLLKAFLGESISSALNEWKGFFQREIIAKWQKYITDVLILSHGANFNQKWHKASYGK